MERLFILLCAMGPSIAFLRYGIVKGRVTWDDPVIWESFCTGGLCAAAVLLPELVLKRAIGIDAMTPLHSAATEALYIAAVPEEFAKLGGMLFVLTRYSDRAVRHDIVLLSLAVALGFAAMENLMYLVAPREWHLLALGRALTAVPSHGVMGLAMGALLTTSERRPRTRDVWLLAAITVPIVLHAAYDFPLLLVRRHQALAGILPAWLLMSILTGGAVLYLCNRMWASSLAHLR